ncbi:hypothetical protein BG005_001581, partial [Podila minutissima]
MAAGPPHTVGFDVLAIGAEGMLNGAGMYEHYPATFDSVEEYTVDDLVHTWIDCAVDPPESVTRLARESYACVSHTWGTLCCKGKRSSCKATGEYQAKHVCLWDKDQKEEDYWDERNIIATIVTTGWKGDLWLDWTDIPQDPVDRQDRDGPQKELNKTRKINTQALLYAEADHVYVCVPQADFNSINKAIRLSETATTCDDFIEVIHRLHGVKWFQSTWTLQEMFMSYERMEVVAGGGKTNPCGGKTIPCGWLGKLKDR